ALALQHAPVYRYFFTKPLDGSPQTAAAGAGHGLEMFSVFQAIERIPNYRPTSSDLATQRSILRFWTEMARSGHPSSADSDAWPAYEVNVDHYLELGSHITPGVGVRSQRCDFWDSLRE